MEVPDDLAAALAEVRASEAFDRSGLQHAKEHVRQVETAKAETFASGASTRSSPVWQQPVITSSPGTWRCCY